MSPRSRRPARLVASTLAIVVALAAASSCIPSEPPRSGTPVGAGVLVFDSNRTGNFELYSIRMDGTATTQLTDDERFDSFWPRLSPDRRTIVFYRTPAGVHDLDYTQTALWTVAADGTGLAPLRGAGHDGWYFQGHVGWSPDGSELVMFGGEQISPQIYVTDAVGQNPRAVTDRPGANIDPSFLADGRIVFIGCAQSWCEPTDYEVILLDPENGTTRQLTDDARQDHDPAVSPDGRRVAWLTQFAPGAWDLQVANIDGSGARRVFGTGTLVGAPVWTSATTLVAHRVVPPGGYQLHRIDVVTGAITNLTINHPGSNEYPSG